MVRIFLITGSILAGLGVVLGAFGGHYLEGHVSPERIQTFETGVRYQMYHSLGLLFVAWAMSQWPVWQIQWAGLAMIAGILLFSGSLYLLVLTDTAWFGAITPLGGLGFITAWVLLVWAFIKQ